MADAEESTGSSAPGSRTSELVVALDGPGSSGKSSVGAAIAERLGLHFFDTGLLYRAVTWLAGQRNVAPTETEALVALAPQVEIEPDERGHMARVVVQGRDVTDLVRTPEVDARVSAYAAVPELRHALLERQRRIAANRGVVMAGRDIGTVVLPDADVKVFLDASADERARRRSDERGLAEDDPRRTAILDALRARDAQDEGRAVAPLRPADGGIVIHTDGNTLAQTIDAVVAAIEGRSNGPRLSRATPATEWRPSRRERRPRPATPIAGHLNPLIHVGAFIARLLAHLFASVTVEGAIDDIPKSGPVILAANHASAGDPVFVGAFLTAKLGRRLNWLGKRELFDVPVLSWLARHGGVHAVERGAADVEAFRIAARILEAGHVLAIFPEGTRSPDGRLQRGMDGVSLLAIRTGAVIVPIGVGNSDVFWPKGRLLPKPRGHVTVRIGTPFLLHEALGLANPKDARRIPKEQATTAIMTRIAALLPERQRGVYAEAASALDERRR
ncbi:MAG: (d)CMP kinase [Chloroflexi bacterium]|nr:(d)CMP kinase [Chloroflexota bacterium]